MYEVDAIGLDRLYRAVLDAIVKKFSGGPVGISTLAMAIGEEAETIESLAEHFLVRMGFISRSPRGRIATAAGYAHLGLVQPKSEANLSPNSTPGQLGIFDTPASDA